MRNAVSIELNEALRIDIFSNPGMEHLRPQARAEHFYSSHPELMEKLKRPWLVKRLTKMIEHRMERGWPEREIEYNLSLPGFDDLPRRIFLKNGRRKLLDTATIRDVQEHLRMLRDRASKTPQIKKIEWVVELMEKYSKTKPRITWKEVRQKELDLAKQ